MKNNTNTPRERGIAALETMSFCNCCVSHASFFLPIFFLPIFFLLPFLFFDPFYSIYFSFLKLYFLLLSSFCSTSLRITCATNLSGHALPLLSSSSSYLVSLSIVETVHIDGRDKTTSTSTHTLSFPYIHTHRIQLGWPCLTIRVTLPDLNSKLAQVVQKPSEFVHVYSRNFVNAKEQKKEENGNLRRRSRLFVYPLCECVRVDVRKRACVDCTTYNKPVPDSTVCFVAHDFEDFNTVFCI